MKKFKRMLAVALCISQGILIPMESKADSATLTKDDQGRWQISNVAELKLIGAGEYLLSDSYILTADIDLSESNWTPIGYTGGGSSTEYKTADAFSGTLDGNGYTISGMNAIATDHSYNYVGLFGVVRGTAVIKNIRFKDCTSTSTAGISAFAGIVAGGMYPSSAGETLANGPTVMNVAIEDCNVLAQGRNLGNQTVAGSVVGHGFCVTLQDVWSNANVKAQYEDDAEGASKQIAAGGMVGACYVGGVIARSVENAHYSPAITNVYAELYDCDWYVGNKLVAQGVSSYTASYYYDEENKLVTPNEIVSVKVTDKADAARWQWYSSDGALELFLEISSAQDLAKIGVDADYPLDGSYVLTRDIDMSSYSNWKPIGDETNIDDSAMESYQCFAGVLDGRGYAIKNLTISDSETAPDGVTQLYYGLFSATRGATIKNLKIANATISISLPANNAGGKAVQVFVGAIAGAAEADNQGNQTIVKNVSVVDSNITSEGFHVSGVGSFVGVTNKRWTTRRNGALDLSDCYSNATLKNTSTNGQGCVGGFIGYAYACKATVPMKLSNSVFLGTVSGKACYAPIIGRVTNGDTTTAYSVEKVYVDANIAISSVGDTYFPLDGTDYTENVSLASTGFSENYWYNTPLGVKQALCLTVGDVDGNNTIDTVDTSYVRKHLIGSVANCDKRTVNVNQDKEVDVRDLVRHMKIRSK